MNTMFPGAGIPSTDIDPAFEPVTKAWGGRDTNDVSHGDPGDFDASNPNCSTERKQDTTTALNDEDLSADEDDISIARRPWRAALRRRVMTRTLVPSSGQKFIWLKRGRIS